MLSLSQLQYAYHHLFFPPKLPQSDDTDAEALYALQLVMQESLQNFIDCVGNSDVKLPLCLRMLEGLTWYRSADGVLMADRLDELLQVSDQQRGKNFKLKPLVAFSFVLTLCSYDSH
jgi:hypothetical protein